MLKLNKNNYTCCNFATKIVISKFFLSLFLLVILINLNACSWAKKVSENEGAKPKPTPVLNALERARSYEGSGIILGKNQTGDKLGTNNLMWKATMSVLDFVPIASASYNGGVIITDWYSGNSSTEAIKIQVTFLNKAIETSSIEVKSYKKVCDKMNSCNTTLANESFNQKIKNKIFQEIRKIKVTSELKK